jgi:Icc-related predicted phosphoesterase
MVKIQIASDLHLEFSYIVLDYTGTDILVLAGDIHSDIGKLKKYILAILKANKNIQIVLIAGNHECYSKTVPETIEKMNRLFNEDKNISNRCHFLQDNFVIIHGIKFIGCTLWCNPPGIYWDEIKKEISDFSNIKNHNIMDCISYFENSVKFIEENFASEYPLIIITHFPPSFSSINQIYSGFTELNHYFASDIEDTILYTNPKIWIHGHTHHTFSYYIGNTKIICNPRGYSDEYNKHEENRIFDRKLVIDI